MSDTIRDFSRIIGEIDRSKHRSEVFRDFCEMAYCALAKAASPNPEQRDKLETQYMDVVGRYRNKDDIWRIKELFHMAVPVIGGGGCDFLGDVAAALGVLDSGLGQFFTPYDVSRLMAEINLDGIDKTIDENGFATVHEPAAGAGGMLVAVADSIEAKGYNLETSLWIEATELSCSTYHMCYIQCAARGLAGRVTHGNSLSLETYTQAFTAAAPLFLNKHGTPFPMQNAGAVSSDPGNSQRTPASPLARGEQLTLF